MVSLKRVGSIRKEEGCVHGAARRVYSANYETFVVRVSSYLDTAMFIVGHDETIALGIELAVIKKANHAHNSVRGEQANA